MIKKTMFYIRLMKTPESAQIHFVIMFAKQKEDEGGITSDHKHQPVFTVPHP